MRKSTIWAVLALLAIIPITTPVGTLYLAEPMLFGGAVVTLLRRAGSTSLPPRLVPPLVLLALTLAGSVVVGHYSGLGYVGHQLRALIDLGSAVVLIANLRVDVAVVHRALLRMCVLLVGALVFERITSYTWDATKLFADVDRSYRVSGPLGPGATANVLFAGAYVAISRRRWPTAAILAVGMLLLASRAHLVALAVLYVALALAARLKPRQLVAGALAGGAAALLVPGGVSRLLAAAQGSEQRRSRGAVWEQVFADTTWGDIWFGVGPGNFVHFPNSRTVTYQAHSQYLTPIVDVGLIGLTCLVVVVLGLWHRARRTATVPFLVAWLAASVFGEFVFAPTVPLMLGALPCWLVVMAGVPSADRRQRRPVRRLVRI